MYHDDAEAEAMAEMNAQAEWEMQQEANAAEGEAAAAEAEANNADPLDSILADYRSTLACVQEEEEQRAAVMATDEFRNLQLSIENAQMLQAAMLAKVPDSREEHEADKQELIAYMQEQGLKRAGEFRAKTRAIRSVDVRAVLEAMQGDIDNLMIVASVKMKDLEEFAKANPEYKRDLRSCIREEGFRISDIILADND